MSLWPQFRITVQSSYPNDYMRLHRPLCHQMRPAVFAKMTQFSWRGLERRNRTRALEPTEMLTLYASRRGKRGGVGFTASFAVAMHNGHIHRVYFVTYLATQTASLQPHGDLLLYICIGNQHRSALEGNQ